jgi:hypothetical protein
MKKIIALFGSLVILGSTKSKAQKPQPVKKETVKPTSGTTPKADAVDIFLPLDGVKGETSASVVKGANPVVTKGANPAFLKGASPTIKPAQAVTKQPIAPRQTPSPVNKRVRVPR